MKHYAEKFLDIRNIVQIWFTKQMCKYGNMLQHSSQYEPL